MSVKKIMNPNPVVVGMEDTVARMRELFEEHRFHHLLVTERGILKGIVSDRDILKALSPYVGTPSEQTRDTSTLFRRAHQVMTRDPITISPEASLADAVSLFNRNKISCLPVVSQGNQPLGMVSWRDILRTMERVSQHKRKVD
ncbi:CBS domain-containing protein [Saccharospirillum alexandrii]|uniref:CBS domain-containing protein n=1 Tax=Saccharospirillum alexandrii TaxID=2448477 RepID=UPI000FDCBB3F|nr:CBS domain-containing protein [Saccharospirillum alexandrii]